MGARTIIFRNRFFVEGGLFRVVTTNNPDLYEIQKGNLKNTRIYEKTRVIGKDQWAKFCKKYDYKNNPKWLAKLSDYDSNLMV